VQLGSSTVVARHLRARSQPQSRRFHNCRSWDLLQIPRLAVPVPAQPGIIGDRPRPYFRAPSDHGNFYAKPDEGGCSDSRPDVRHHCGQHVFLVALVSGQERILERPTSPAAIFRTRLRSHTSIVDHGLLDSQGGKPVERMRRVPVAARRRERRQGDSSPRQTLSDVGVVLELQRTAGNRRVAAALGGSTVQREPAKASPNKGGVLTLGTEEAFPIVSATWSLTSKLAQHQEGSRREIELVAASHPFVAELALTRRKDKHSPRFANLLSRSFDAGNLRLDVPSRDGALPAANLELHDVVIFSHTTGRGEHEGVERISLAVDDLRIAGLGKEASEKEMRAGPGSARVSWWLDMAAGSDVWPQIPLIAANFDRPSEIAIAAGGPGLGRRHPETVGPVRLTVRLGAGMALTRIAEALGNRTLFTRIALTAEAGTGPQGTRFMTDALVEKVRSTADGPNVVEVVFVGLTSGDERKH
jgi:hypothetical protein